MKARASQAILLGTILSGVIFGASCASAPPCKAAPDTSPNENCWFGNCRAETLLFPNPVQRGGTLNLKISCGGATRNMQFVSTSMRVKICDELGRQVANFTVGPIPPNSNVQTVAIWSNISVAPAVYFVTVVGDIGDCGTVTLINASKIAVN